MKASILLRLAAISCVVALVWLVAPAGASSADAADASDAAAPRSPANQVFHWAFTGTCGEWPDGSQSTATGYLWIPEDCVRLRGLLILGTNVPEHMLVGDPAIRSVCAEKNLGIVWFVPTFWNFRKFPEQTEAAQEWGQSQSDIRTAWQNVTGMYEGWSRGRAGTNWPLSLAIEPGTGHFHCTDAMTELFATYIRAAADARLSPNGGNTLAAVNLDAGVVAELPVPGHEAAAITPYPRATAEERQRPWFFDETTARMAQRLAVEDWTAATRLPGFESVEGCTVKPFSLNSVTDIDVEFDGEFAVRGVVLDRIPDGFVGAGEPLPTDHGPPAIEWICGPIVPLGDARFQVAPDRTYPFTTSYIAAEHNGAKGLRPSLQPARVKPRENRGGVAQTITFESLPDGPVGSRDLPLEATSSAGLPVGFYVESGPAVVEGDRLVFTRIPPRTAFPVRVTVAAWQWGRHSEPQVQTAPIVRRSFTIVKTTLPSGGSP